MTSMEAHSLKSSWFPTYRAGRDILSCDFIPREVNRRGF